MEKVEFVGRCSDLNLVHGFDDTGKVNLQEHNALPGGAYMKQTVELHPIYAQRDLMKNINFKELAEVNKYAPCGTEQPRADVKLALNIGGDDWQNGGGRRDYRKKFVETESMGDVRDTSTLSSLGVPSCSGDYQNSPDSVLFVHSIGNSSIMHAPYGSTTSSPNVISCRGLKQHHDDLHLNYGKKNMTSSLNEWEELDLNTFPCDESFSHCNDLTMSNSPRFSVASPLHRSVGEFQFGISTFSNITREQAQGNNFSQSSSWVQQEPDSTYNQYEDKSNGKSHRGSVRYRTNIESVFGMSPGIQKKLDCHRRNHNFVCIPAPSNEICKDVLIQESSSLNVKDDVTSSKVNCQGNTDEGICSIQCMSCKKNVSSGNFSGTNNVQVGNDLDSVKVYSQGVFHDDDLSVYTKYSLEQDLEPSLVNYVKAQPVKPPENDSSVQRGEVTLSYFVVGDSSKYQDWVKETNRTTNVKKERSQHSSDSFESIVLKLPASNVDDYCVTSKQYEVDETSTKDCGIKLRRGLRRIKDFRKDVLPHLPSLSPKEIREDLKIMQDALRSREFKRLRSKVQNRETGSTPLKSSITRCNRVSKGEDMKKIQFQ